MKVTFDAHDLERRFGKFVKQRREAKRSSANSVRLGVLLDNAKVKVALVNQVPQLEQNQEAFKVTFEPSDSGRDVYMRVDLRKERLWGMALGDEQGSHDVVGQWQVYTRLYGNTSFYPKFPLHRLIVAFHLELEMKGLEVHHINLNTHNNHISNLLLTSKGTHDQAHELIDRALAKIAKDETSLHTLLTSKPSLQSLQERYPDLHTVVTYKSHRSSDYIHESLENIGEIRNRRSMTVAELKAMPVMMELRNSRNIQLFEPPRGYATNMTRVLQVMDKLTPIRQVEIPESERWIKKSVILEQLKIDKVGQKYSVETAERWLQSLATCQLIEKQLSGNSRATGFYRLTWNAYTFAAGSH